MFFSSPPLDISPQLCYAYLRSGPILPVAVRLHGPTASSCTTRYSRRIPISHTTQLTTQSINLPGRLPSGPIRVQRPDKSCYIEASETEISRLVESGIVEGIGPRTGRIDVLRITVPEEEAVKRLAAVTRPVAVYEKPGNITSMASREVFREILPDGVHWVWTHKQNREMKAGTSRRQHTSNSELLGQVSREATV